MNIQIHSISSIQRLSYKPFLPGTFLISIGDIGAEMPYLQYKPEEILRLNFNDITLSDMDYESSGRYAFHLFSGEQAKQIADFIYKNKEHMKELICQCHFGQSRSAAVAAAVKEHFDHSGIEIFADDQERYCPNIYVFRITLKALEERAKEEK